MDVLYEMSVHAMGIPWKIGNDPGATDVTFGCNSAVSIAIESLDKLHTTPESLFSKCPD